MAVVTTRKFDNLVATSKPPRQSNSAHAGLGSAIHKANLVDVRNHFYSEFSQLGFELGRHSK